MSGFDRLYDSIETPEERDFELWSEEMPGSYRWTLLGFLLTAEARG